jgi:putative membrane protein (TIGR04086 family)
LEVWVVTGNVQTRGTPPEAKEPPPLWKSVVAGIVAAYLVSLLASAAVGAMVLRTTLAQGNLTSLMGWIGQSSILIGALYAAKRARQAGLVTGALTGAGYIVVSFILGALVFPEPVNFVVLGQRLLMGLFVGALGGAAGVNL